MRLTVTVEPPRTPNPLIHIIILGKEGVGKSALAVRFLTRRFLSEFAESEETSYERTITLDGDRQVALRITDVSGKSLQTRAASRELLLQADAAVLVYSVTDQTSVTAARHALSCVRKFRPSAAPHVAHALIPPGNTAAQSQSTLSVTSGSLSTAPPPFPVLLLGNKCDLDHVRTVQRQREPAEWTSDYTMTSECSARDDVEAVTSLFHNLIRKVLEIRSANTRSSRKLSQGVLGSPSQLTSSIRRRLSMFSKDRVATI